MLEDQLATWLAGKIISSSTLLNPPMYGVLLMVGRGTNSASSELANQCRCTLARFWDGELDSLRQWQQARETDPNLYGRICTPLN